MLASLGAADWVQAEGWREGLFTQCVKAGAATPLPFNGDPTPGCRKAHSAGYVRGAAALAIICFITDFFGTLLTGLGLRSTDPNKKYKYYRVAIYSLAVAGRISRIKCYQSFFTWENILIELEVDFTFLLIVNHSVKNHT